MDEKRIESAKMEQLIKNMQAWDLIPTEEEAEEMGMKFTMITEGLDDPYLQVKVKGSLKIINFLKILKGTIYKE